MLIVSLIPRLGFATNMYSKMQCFRRLNAKVTVMITVTS